MNVICVWFLFYGLPWIVASMLIKFLARRDEAPLRDSVVVHGALIISILGSQSMSHAAGLNFPWMASSISVVIYVLVALVAVRGIGVFGFWYALSALIQQLTMISMAFFLLPVFPVFIVVLLITPIFVVSHEIRGKIWPLKILLFSLWGAISIILFALLSDVWLNAGLHTAFGALLISASVLYPDHSKCARFAALNRVRKATAWD